MDQLLEFSDEYSTLVAVVRNLVTNFVSPQFHVLFDENFYTIQNNTRLEYTAVEAISMTSSPIAVVFMVKRSFRLLQLQYIQA